MDDARCNAEAAHYYGRITQWVMPNVTMIPPAAATPCTNTVGYSSATRTAGPGSQAASTIGATCRLDHVTTTVLVVGAGSASDEAVAETLAQVRPWSLMLVIATPDDYINDMLVALRA